MQKSGFDAKSYLNENRASYIEEFSSKPRHVINFQAAGALEEHRRMREYLRRMEREGVQRVKMFLVITAAYVLFWGPLFFVTLIHHPIVGNPLGYEVRDTFIHCANF